MTGDKAPRWPLTLIYIYYALVIGAALLALAVWQDWRDGRSSDLTDKILFGQPLPLAVVLAILTVACWRKGSRKTAYLLTLAPIPAVYGLIAAANMVGGS